MKTVPSPSPGWPNLTQAHYDQLKGVCENCAARAQFFDDLAKMGVPVDAFTEQNSMTHQRAMAMLAKAFPGQAA